MQLSLSVRIAEDHFDKTRLAVPFPAILEMARRIGYRGICMRGSVVSVDSPHEQMKEVADLLRRAGLAVSMLTGDVGLAANDEHATDAIHNITPYLDLAQTFGTRRLRVMMTSEGDIPLAQRAADEARERDMLLCHQTHQRTLFERVGECLDVLRRVNRPNFGVTFEPANLLICGDDYGPEQIQRLGPHIFNVYLQNCQVGPDGTRVEQTNRGPVRTTPLPIGDKRGVDLDRVFAGLRAIGYDGWVTVHSAMVPGLTVAESAQRYHDVLRPYVD